MSKKSHLKLSRVPVMTLSRGALGADQLVYLLAVNKPVKYLHGKSRIVYIGTTKRGVIRVASSVAHRSARVLQQPGLRTVEAHLLTYGGKPGVRKLWAKLERAMLIMFKFEYGDIPRLNQMGRNLWPGQEFKYFTRRALLKHSASFRSNAGSALPNKRLPQESPRGGEDELRLLSFVATMTP